MTTDRTAVLWRRIDELVDASPSVLDLREHGLELLAARRWRALGSVVPESVLQAERDAAFRSLAVPGVLAEVRAAWDGPILLFKGPVAAELYSDPLLRPFGDLDLLVGDAAAAQAALSRAGFYGGVDPAHMAHVRHHLEPLHSPTLPLHVELHSHPRWLNGREPPRFERLRDMSEPARLGVDGIHTLAPAAHAVVLAVHAWSHDPLTRLLRLVDVALMTAETGEADVEAVAREWGLRRLWRTTWAVTRAVLGDEGRRPLPLHIWARGLLTAREASVLETHLARCLSPFWTAPAARVPTGFATAVVSSLLREEGETWSVKLGRVRDQLRRPSMRRSKHLERLASRPSAARRK